MKGTLPKMQVMNNDGEYEPNVQTMNVDEHDDQGCYYVPEEDDEYK